MDPAVFENDEFGGVSIVNVSAYMHPPKLDCESVTFAFGNFGASVGHDVVFGTRVDLIDLEIATPHHTCHVWTECVHTIDSEFRKV